MVHVDISHSKTGCLQSIKAMVLDRSNMNLSNQSDNIFSWLLSHIEAIPQIHFFKRLYIRCPFMAKKWLQRNNFWCIKREIQLTLFQHPKSSLWSGQRFSLTSRATSTSKETCQNYWTEPWPFHLSWDSYWCASNLDS